MTALSGPERKQAMDAITKAIDSFLKTQEPTFEDAFYRPDLVLVKGTKDWDLKGVSSAVVETKGGGEKKFTLSGKMVATAGDYSSYKLDGAAFAWK